MENVSTNEQQEELQIEKFENEGNVGELHLVHEYHKYICEVCNYIYDEVEGEEKVGLAPGMLWEDIPEDWRCPECSAIKSSFKKLG